MSNLPNQPKPQDQNQILEKLAYQSHLHYDLPQNSTIQLLNLSENATFLISNPRANFKSILRIHRPGYHSDQAIESEIHWLLDLQNHDHITIAKPIPGRNGKYLQILSIPDPPETRRAVMFEFLPGKEPDANDLNSFEKLGTVTAHLHLHAQSWDKAPSINRHTWDLHTMFFSEKPTWGRWQDGLGVTAERGSILARLADKIAAEISNYGKNNNNFGLIHADLRLANLLLDGENVKVIDFDDCGFSWYLYDLATALSFIEDQPQIPQLISAWLKGYEKIKPLHREEKEIIPFLIMARRLLLLAWVGSHQEAPFPRQLGEGFTISTCRLAEKFLNNDWQII